MPKKFIFIYLFLIWMTGYADEISNINSLQRQLNYCDSVKPSPNNMTASFKCMRDAWVNFGSVTQFNSLKSGSSNLVFVIQQTINLFDDASRNPNYSESDLKERMALLMNIYNNERAVMKSNLSREISEISVQEANIRTTNFISNLVTLLSGAKTTSSVNSATYIINGRIINCQAIGSFTNCF